MSTVTISQSQHVVSIVLEGEFDVANVEELRAVALQAVSSPGVAHIVVDLAQVAFMGSTALGALIGLRADAARDSLGLSLSNVSARVWRLLDLTGLDTVFEMTPAARSDGVLDSGSGPDSGVAQEADEPSGG